METRKEEVLAADAVLVLDNAERRSLQLQDQENNICNAEEPCANSSTKSDVEKNGKPIDKNLEWNVEKNGQHENEIPESNNELNVQLDDANLESHKKSRKPTSGPLPVSFYCRNERQLKVFDSKETDKLNVATVKPVLMKKINHKKGLQVSSNVQATTASKWEFEENIFLPSYKIRLLNQFRFRVKHETECVKITFEETESKVTFRAMTFDEIKDVKLKMYKCLDAFVSDEEPITEKRFEFLSRKQCLSHLQQKCEEIENINVLYQTDKQRKCIRCYSFNEDDACRGIQLLKDEVTLLNVNIMVAQHKCLKTPAWVSFKKSLDKGLTTVYQDEKDASIVIESLSEDKALEAEKRIIRFLKEHTKNKVATVILETSKARCFQARLEDKLLRKKQKDATFNVVVLSEDPLKLKVSLEGEEYIADKLHAMVEEMWQESIDISGMTLEVDDALLIMRGLCHLTGKEFLAKFEQTHNCFIEIPTVEGKAVFNARASSENISEFWDIDTAVEREDFTENVTEVTTYGPKPQTPQKAKPNGKKTRKNKRGRFHHYQFGLNEDEAMQMAILLSNESSYSDGHNASPLETSSLEKENTFQFDDMHGTILLEEEDVFKGTSSLAEQQQEYDLHETNEVPQEHAREPRDLKPTDFKTRHLFMFKTTLKLVQGQIAKQRADTLVNVISSPDAPFEGTVSKTFLEAGGPLVSQMYECAALTSSCVVVTGSSGQLSCSTVFHVKMEGSVPYNRMISRAISNVLAECQNWACTSVAFPPLGVGDILQYPPGGAAETMVTEIARQLQNGSSVKQILVVIRDDETYAIFDETFQKFKQSAAYFNQGTSKQTFDAPGTKNRDRSSRAMPCSLASKGQSQTVSNERRSARTYSPELNKVSNCRPYKKPRACNAEPYHRRSKNTRASYQERLEDSTTYGQGWNKADVSPSNDYYIIRGQEGRVRKTYTEILKILLDEKSVMAERTKQIPKIERETHEFIEAMMKAEPEAPNYWKNYKPGVSLESILTSARHLINRTKFEKVDLVHSRHVFSTIVKMINGTFDPSVVGKGKDAEGLGFFKYKKLFVLKIERIENLDLYEQFTRKKQILYRKLYTSGNVKFPRIEDFPNCSGGVTTDSYAHPALDKELHSEVNEYLLFHGTKEENVLTICNDGLDPRINSGNAMFGSGIYAAECATKADQYADDKSNRSAGRGCRKQMFLIRMVLGHSYVYTEKKPRQFRRPPCKRCLKDDCKDATHMNGEFGHTFDSVVGDNRKLFREFVLYDSSLCYPEYLITYERR